MAQEEHDREDLLAEATALVERVSLRLGGDADETVAGFRRDGSLSIFFGGSLVYQFNSAGQLRRGFAGGELLKAVGGKLVAMRRERHADVVQMLSRPLDEQATRRFLDEMHAHLDRLKTCLTTGDFETLGQVPEEVDVVGRVKEWLDRFAAGVTIAASPHAR